MTTAKVFTTGRSQAVRLPKEFRFTGDEVNVTRIGDLIVLCPKGKEDEIFFSSLGNFTNDFYESVASARKELLPDSPRELF